MFYDFNNFSEGLLAVRDIFDKKIKMIEMIKMIKMNFAFQKNDRAKITSLINVYI